MKQFILKKVKYKNILSVGNTPIEIDLCSYNKTLCTGRNGAGKTTILEAIFFGLFGKPYRDIKKNALVNSINKKGLEVEVWFDYNNDEFYVQRGIKPNKLKIQKNGEDLDESASVKDFQEFFEEMIGMTSASAKQTMILGTAGFTPFMQLKPAERRKFVEDLLGVSVLADMDKLNKQALREITQNISVVEMKIQHLEQQKRTHIEYQETAKRNSDEQIQRQEELYQQHVTKAHECKAKIQELNEQIKSTACLDVDPALQLTKYRGAVIKLETQKEQFSKVKHMHEGGGTCPTCMQQFSDSFLLGKIDETISTADGNIAKLKDRLLVLETEKQEYDKRQRLIADLSSQITVQTTQLQQHVSTAQQIKATIASLQVEVQDKSDEIHRLTEEISVQVQAKSNLMMEKYYRSNITELLKDSGVKASVVKEYIPYFNKRIAYYLDILEADYAFTLDEEFNEVIKSVGRENFDYNSFSQGEKARIDLALLFSWREVSATISGVSINALFLDEILDGPSDEDCIKAIFRILGEMQDKNIFIISHGDYDTQKFNRHIKLTKSGRFSVIDDIEINE